MNDKDSIRLSHIQDACGELIQIISHFESLEAFLSHRLYQHATVRLLEIIGEACGSVSEECRDSYPIIEWQAWKDMRNILIHQYFGVDYKRVYLVAKNEIPELLIGINQILGR
ncbi:MAG: DUF86 domain-containing protein [Leptospiraceae bacterium]|nr:DUF86 domain-containing protein [Leptospiraceae bacterium]